MILIQPQTERILIAQLQGLYAKSAANEMWGVLFEAPVCGNSIGRSHFAASSSFSN